MTLPSEHHAQSDTTSSPGRPWIVRWRLRLPWALLVLTVIISYFWVRRLRSDVPHDRRVAANVVWLEMNEVAAPLEAIARFTPDTLDWTAESRLREVQLEAKDIQNSVRRYQQVIGATAPGQFAAFDRVFRLFELIADTIVHSDEIADERAALTALTADMRLLLALFPRELLHHGSVAELDQAMTTWCDQMQLKTLPSSLTKGDSHLIPCP
jgi:hypothetical protein